MWASKMAPVKSWVGPIQLIGLYACFTEMTESFCVGGGRRLQGSSKSGSGKGGSRKEVQLPMLQDPPKLGEELGQKSILEDTDSRW